MKIINGHIPCPKQGTPASSPCMMNEPSGTFIRNIRPQFVIDALKQHRLYQLEEQAKAAGRWKDRGLVFANRCGGYFSSPRLYSRFKKLLNEAGLPGMRFHDLRHSAATILLSMGVSAKVVQQILGHSNISTTLNIYGHALPEMHRDAMDKMDDFFGGE